MIKKLLREPLVHFLFAALLLFVFFDNADYPNDADVDVVRISNTKIQVIQKEWQKQWLRPPSDKELDGLVTSAIHAELYYREGLRLRLDQDDVVVRNRMIQKMQFLQDSQVLEPNEEQLASWLKENKVQYPDSKFYSFRQVYLGAQVSKVEAQTVASGLNDGELTIENVGQSLLVPSQMDAADSKEVARSFGTDFSTALRSLTMQRWEGPVLSGFGSHLVKLVRVETIPMSLDVPAMAKKIRNDWISVQKTKAEKEMIDALLERYTVEVEGQ